MSNAPASIGEFQALAGEVDAGRLRMDDEAAERCAKVCDTYIEGLRSIKDTGRNLVRLEAFGQLDSAKALGEKFFKLASGGGGSFEDVIQQHIDAAMQMRDVFTKAGAAYKATDQSTSQALGAAGSQL